MNATAAFRCVGETISHIFHHARAGLTGASRTTPTVTFEVTVGGCIAKPTASGALAGVQRFSPHPRRVARANGVELAQV